MFPERCSHEVLEIEKECLKNYIYYNGYNGFFAYSRKLLLSPHVIEVHIQSNKYIFQKLCVNCKLERLNLIWAIWISKRTGVNYLVKKLLRMR